jgi:hypothetical protein
MTTCKNCTQNFEGNYCPECGQKASTKRFSTKILFSELVDKILPIDRGVLYTSWQMLTHPGSMLRDYLDGKRAKITKPIQFLLIMVALSLIFFSQDEFKEGIKAGYSVSGDPQSDASKAFSQQWMQWITDNMTALVVGIIPFMALMARWLFRKRDLNLAEHVVVSCYLVAGSTLAGMPVMLVMRLMGQNAYSPTMSGFFGLIYIAFCVWGYISLFKGYKAWNTGFKATLVVLLGYFLYILVMMFLLLIFVLVYVSFFEKGR